MIKTIIAIFVSAAAMQAQIPNTFQKVFSSLTWTQIRAQSFTALRSASVNNIGQTGHQALLVLRNNTPAGLTCPALTTNAVVSIVGSYDGTTWVPIASPAQAFTPFSNTNTSYAIQITSGLYPQIALSVDITYLAPHNPPNADPCVIDAWYSGTAGGIPQSVSLVQPYSGLLTANGAVIAEKAFRSAATSAPASGSVASISGEIETSFNATNFIDCISVGAQVQTTLGAAVSSTVSLVSNSQTKWTLPVGFPNGTTPGTTFNYSICGLNIPIFPGDNSAALAFSAGMTTTTETLSVTLYQKSAQ